MTVQGVDAIFPAGTMSAVMGPSGAGKTSFLNSLRGTAAAYGTITGSVFLNGNPQTKGLLKAKDIVGFVPQDDCVHEVTLTNLISMCACTHTRTHTHMYIQYHRNMSDTESIGHQLLVCSP